MWNQVEKDWCPPVVIAPVVCFYSASQARSRTWLTSTGVPLPGFIMMVCIWGLGSVSPLPAKQRPKRSMGIRRVTGSTPFLTLQDYKIGLPASQVVRLIGLLLIFASQKIPVVHNVRNEMARSIVPLRKKIKDSLTRQGMWNIRGLHRKGLAEREENGRVLSSERAHKQVLTVTHELNVNMREIHLVEVKYREDTRSGHQLEASRIQHEVLSKTSCKRLKAKKVILHTILLGVGGSIYTSHTLNHLKEIGLDTQNAHKAALKLHAHSVLYAHNLSTTRRALEKSGCSQGLGLEQGAACHPPNPH